MGAARAEAFAAAVAAAAAASKGQETVAAEAAAAEEAALEAARERAAGSARVVAKAWVVAAGGRTCTLSSDRAGSPRMRATPRSSICTVACRYHP